MYLTLATIAALIMPYTITESLIKDEKKEVVFEQIDPAQKTLATKIIYTKVPTSWVKVVNN